MTVIVQHDRGCKWARIGAEAEIVDGQVVGYTPGAGHSDAAKRFSDTYNLHHAAGITSGWIAVRYQDGTGGMDVFDTREEAVEHMFPREDWYFYATLAGPPSMSVCAAESVLRWKRVMSEAERADREAPHGGLEVVPFLTEEDRAEQVQAAKRGGLLAMAHRLRGDRR
jgi:hypothetical protein